MITTDQTPPKLGIVAHDAGGARALAPVAAEWMAQGGSVQAIMAGPAVPIWNHEFPGMSFHALPDDTSVLSLTNLLATSHTDLLLSAAGLYNQIEHRTRVAARAAGLPVAAILDSWFNYTERFERSEDGNSVPCKPDVVCVIDGLSRDEMIKAGFAAAAVALTGHPDLERQCRMPVPAEPEARNSCLRDVGLNDHALLLCFFSDPFFIGPDRKYYSGPGAIMNADGTGLFGYTVCDILPEVIQELEAALQTAGAQALLIVKPHPSEDATVLKELLAAARTSHLQLRLGDTASAAECIHRADAFFGMMTIALLQAALAGKPAVSVELGLLESGQKDPCMSNSLGHTLGVFDRAALQTACRAVAQRDWPALRTRPRHELPLIGAARRVVSVLRGMQPFQPDHCRRP